MTKYRRKTANAKERDRMKQVSMMMMMMMMMMMKQVRNCDDDDGFTDDGLGTRVGQQMQMIR